VSVSAGESRSWVVILEVTCNRRCSDPSALQARLVTAVQAVVAEAAGADAGAGAGISVSGQPITLSKTRDDIIQPMLRPPRARGSAQSVSEKRRQGKREAEQRKRTRRQVAAGKVTARTAASITVNLKPSVLGASVSAAVVSRFAGSSSIGGRLHSSALCRQRQCREVIHMARRGLATA
jgi:hypothetical protein